MPKLLRLTTSDITLHNLLCGQLAYLRSCGWEVVAVSADTGLLGAVGRREGVRVATVPMRRAPSIWHDLAALFRLTALFRREHPDIVHASTPKAALLGMAAAWMARVPVRIYTVTGLRFETARGTLRRVLCLCERVACAAATRVVPEGDGVARTLREARITRKPLRKVHHGNMNGVDLRRFRLSAEVVAEAAKWRSPSFTFAFVGRMVGDKGVDALVEAFSALHAECPHTRLLLVGRTEEALDPLHPYTVRRIAAGDGIVAAGFQNDVRPLMAAADVVVLPSRREGFPNVLLQAGAMERAAISTDVNGARETLVDGKTGRIVPRGDNRALADAMRELYDNPEWTREMGRKARDVVAQKFRQEDVWRETEKMYREACGVTGSCNL